MTARSITAPITALGSLMAKPWAFIIVGVYGVLWFVFEEETFDWHGVATLATWTMTLFIQRAEHRDTQALHAKLDELLRADGSARSEMANVDDQEPEQIEKHREQRQDDDRR